MLVDMDIDHNPAVHYREFMCKASQVLTVWRTLSFGDRIHRWRHQGILLPKMSDIPSGKPQEYSFVHTDCSVYRVV